MSRRLVLIRHAESAQDPRVPVHRWSLTAEGRRHCAALASRLATFSPAFVASSPEPKALETARITTAHLGRDAAAIEIVDGLREHARETLPWLSQEVFDEKLREFFARPDVLVIGEETAAEALLRFTRAIAKISEMAELKFGPTTVRDGSTTVRDGSTTVRDGPTTVTTVEDGGDVFVFTHATVMALFVAACTRQEAFSFWQQLEQPSFAVLSLPELNLLETVTGVGRSA